ncbi:hypothetical protein Bca4012_052201 [Brassica carinata]|uniref:Uncharacterized protein n=2 Tax=Brassica TaxID=3705 RepID=A0A3P6DRF7_BRAOL|nr:unnamed protein product [Brassica napus]VDD26074.1 unnamed protein product [Brassica oleracea]
MRFGRGRRGSSTVEGRACVIPSGVDRDRGYRLTGYYTRAVDPAGPGAHIDEGDADNVEG